MPSVAHQKWFTSRAAELDRIETAHLKVGGTGPGRRVTTQQLNQAYALLLSSHFQGFCRELHSGAVAFIVNQVQPATLAQIIQVELSRDRKLDKGNPNPGNLGSDFGRLGFDL